MGPLPRIANGPFEKYEVDAMGPLPRTANGKLYILVAIDYMTRFGAPLEIVSDNGPRFRKGRQEQNNDEAWIDRLLNLVDLEWKREVAYHCYERKALQLKDKLNEGFKDKKIKEKSLVLRYNNALNNRFDVKFERRWEGHFIVKKAFTSGYYRLMDLNGKDHSRKVNGYRLKPYLSRILPAVFETKQVSKKAKKALALTGLPSSTHRVHPQNPLSQIMKAHRPGSSDGNRTLQLDPTSSAPLSLKARETASLSLKRIFEQQLIVQQQQQRSNFDLPIATSVTSINMNETDAHVDHGGRQVDDIKPTQRPAEVRPDLDLKLAPPSTSYTTINDQNGERMSTAGMNRGQLTMFYAGSVRVYEDVPAQKAQAILLLASGISRGDSYHAGYAINNVRAMNGIQSRPPTPPLIIQSSTAESTDVSNLTRPAAKPFRRSQAELPFARKASLTRFLEKRKERVEEKVLAGAATDTALSTEPPLPPSQKRPCLTYPSAMHQSA
ncbi:hypothetical protein L7F22_044780 [Adiantum nelumboides]|nr:hypothetical protein [Adiantum nelumboides]